MANWLLTIDGWADAIHLYDEDEDNFEESRDAIVKVLETSRWHKESGEDSELWQAIDELRDTQNADESEPVLDSIYDLADADRVWLNPIQKAE